MRIRTITLAALAAGFFGLVSLSTARADTPKPDAAARQKFVALLTSVKPAAKAPGAEIKAGSLQAFTGPTAATPIRGRRGR